MALRLSNGKFYDVKTNNEVRPEHGNQEQIKLIQRAERIMTSLIEGHEVEVSYKVVASFQFECACGNILGSYDRPVEDYDDVRSLEAIVIRCSHCGKKYFTQDFGSLHIKMEKNE